MDASGAYGWGARALADFHAEFDVELSVKQGDALTVLAVEAPEGWLMARNCEGQSGLVPESYLDEAEDEAADAGDIAPEGGFMDVGRGRLLTGFVAEADGELSVEAGGVVTLLEPEGGLPEGWLYGQRNSKEGLVPHSYVEVRAPLGLLLASRAARAAAHMREPRLHMHTRVLCMQDAELFPSRCPWTVSAR